MEAESAFDKERDDACENKVSMHCQMAKKGKSVCDQGFGKGLEWPRLTGSVEARNGRPAQSKGTARVDVDGDGKRKRGSWLAMWPVASHVQRIRRYLVRCISADGGSRAVN